MLGRNATGMTTRGPAVSALRDPENRKMTSLFQTPVVRCVIPEAGEAAGGLSGGVDGPSEGRHWPRTGDHLNRFSSGRFHSDHPVWLLVFLYFLLIFISYF